MKALKPEPTHPEHFVAMPDHTYLTSKQTAAYLNITTQTLTNWRHKRKGPTYEGQGRFIRYRLGALKEFMSARAKEVKLPPE
jgi:hypothetical protein